MGFAEGVNWFPPVVAHNLACGVADNVTMVFLEFGVIVEVVTQAILCPAAWTGEALLFQPFKEYRVQRIIGLEDNVKITVGEGPII